MALAAKNQERKTREKYNELGILAKVVLEMHLEDPQDFDEKRLLDALFDKYEKLNFNYEEGE